jgi:hypothetical protein
MAKLGREPVHVLLGSDYFSWRVVSWIMNPLFCYIGVSENMIYPKIAMLIWKCDISISQNPKIVIYLK